MTRSVISRMPAHPAHLAPQVSRGADSGNCTTLPWTARDEGDAFLYLGLTRRARDADTGEDSHSSPDLDLGLGDMVLLDAPHHLRLARDPRLTFFRVPCSQLGVAPAQLRHLSRLRVDATHGVPALIAGFLDTLTAEGGLADSATGRRLALNAVDLIALLVAELLEPHRPAGSDPGNDLLVRIRSHIEENLMDPDLSPESIARAHHISVRYLHKLFHAGGTTVSTYVRQRRLAACRLDLGRSRNRRRTVAAVAQTWGFANPSHFSRVFRQTYGVSPSEWQLSASGAHPGD
ncbi:hypothetical protein GCM10010238_12950 [Streptomyces griseoviridis]|uniref:HTH araC/xylS-type domain-containing protein n=2 Tax=Streptomyces griseoviridis TaxID=45398 RepID=A0A918LB22_STRGD|nr:hypothetical protein GCM10010238_12950 [Streptomyces niveoruber]